MNIHRAAGIVLQSRPMSAARDAAFPVSSMSDGGPFPKTLFPTCAALRAHGIDVETHSHVLAVLVDAVSHMAGGPEALQAALEEVRARESLFSAAGGREPALLMTADFVDAWRVVGD